MRQFTTSEAKTLLRNILAEKKEKAEYFKTNGTLKGYAPTKQFFVVYPIIEDQGAFCFETETQNKISVVFSDLTQQFEAAFPIFCVDIYRRVNDKRNNERVNDISGCNTRDTIVSIVRDFQTSTIVLLQLSLILLRTVKAEPDLDFLNLGLIYTEKRIFL